MMSDNQTWETFLGEGERWDDDGAVAEVAGESSVVIEIAVE